VVEALTCAWWHEIRKDRVATTIKITAGDTVYTTSLICPVRKITALLGIEAHWSIP
jgi:hypothetical protein